MSNGRRGDRDLDDAVIESSKGYIRPEQYNTIHDLASTQNMVITPSLQSPDAMQRNPTSTH